jgi:hypothetical protein
LAFRRVGWRLPLAISWALYGAYQLAHPQLTSAGFETVFPLLAWQLPFVHGIALGYYREPISAWVAGRPRAILWTATVGTAAFMAFALCNPEVNGPSWLRWRLISGEQFSMLYERYFSLSDLGIGRILNLAVALPFGYAVLASRGIRSIAFRLQPLFVTLGQASLAAFVLHVYGLLLVAHLPESDHLWINTIIQIALILGIAGALKAIQLMPLRRRLTPVPQPLPV